MSVFTLAASTDFSAVTQPIIGLLESIFNVMIPVVAALGAIYCVILGLKLAKAEEQQDRDKAKQSLKNAITGFVLIFVLVVALRIAVPILNNWATNSTTPPTTETETE